MKERYLRRDTLLRIQQLPMDIVDLDLLNEKSEAEINIVDMSVSKKKSLQSKELPLTQETLLGIFYKYHYYKPMNTSVEKSKGKKKRT